jgi:hypothetical protein
VIFDKTVFPFTEFHPNAGALLKSKILLLHPTLRNIQRGDGVEELIVTNLANEVHEVFADSNETGGESGACSSANTRQNPVDPVGVEELGTHFGADTQPPESALEREQIPVIVKSVPPHVLENLRRRSVLGPQRWILWDFLCRTTILQVHH